jgi:hypothetical protein
VVSSYKDWPSPRSFITVVVRAVASRRTVLVALTCKWSPFCRDFSSLLRRYPRCYAQASRQGGPNTPLSDRERRGGQRAALALTASALVIGPVAGLKGRVISAKSPEPCGQPFAP